MKKQPIFVAVDTNNIKRARQIINATNKYIYGVKFGLEFFCSKGGREAIKKFKNKNVDSGASLADILGPAMLSEKKPKKSKKDKKEE